MRLGDSVARALAVVGVTEDRVKALLGVPDCGCGTRKEALNALGVWAARVLRGKVAGAREHLFALFSAAPDEETR